MAGIDGIWNIVVNSPMGKQESKITLQSDGATLTGTGEAQGASAPISNGRIEGDKATWSATVTSPFPMTLEFDGTLAGDTLNGNVKAGAFGSFPFTGTRG
jgi:hypothetical protein